MKKILCILLVLACFPAVSFGYLEAKLFCNIDQQEIKVSINTKGAATCKAYITYIEQNMRKTARELSTIQGYIKKEQDMDYWMQIRREKLASINTLQGIRLNIMASMKTFEANLLRKSVDYFVLKVTPYKIQLTKSLSKLAVYTGEVPSNIAKVAILMSGQVQIIDRIAKAQTFEELLPLLNGYIYLKKEISGKSE